MEVWTPDQAQALGDALEKAAKAGPAVLVAEGEVGTGKSSFLDELTARAIDFHVLAAEGNETDRKAYDTFLQWGVEPPTTGGAAAAAQQLNARIDELAKTRPILLRIDDIQWADPESIEALTWLLTRSAGDQLLVAIAGQALPPHLHPDWQRWASVRGRAAKVTLTGLDLGGTAALARSVHPSLGDVSIKQLWEHTSGNPLYLSALLSEYEAAELMQMRKLPAPAEFAVVLGQRLSRLPDECVAILRASAVLGSGWKPLVDVAALAKVSNPDLAVETAIEERLLESRDLGMGVAIRIPQTLVRATIYQQIPLHTRHELHAAATGVVHQTAERFEHRIGAVAQHDEELAAELEKWALILHDERTHRDAGRYLRAASGVSGNPQDRHRRWLDSLYETILAQDLELARLEVYDIEQAEDYVRRDLLMGALATFEQENNEAVYWLKKQLGEDETDAPADPAMHYRIEIILAWARVQGAGTTEEIAAGLARASKLEPKDVALHSWALFAGGMVALRTHPVQEILEQFVDMPDNPVAVPWQLRFQLAWRGTVRAFTGIQRGAIADLDNVLNNREEEGALEAAAPHFRALLGWGHWLNGDWNHARLNFGLAVDIGGRYLAPTAAALRPLHAIGRGELAEADELIAVADAMLTQDPWVEAVDELNIVRVARVHAGGLPHMGVTSAFERMRGDLRNVQAGRIYKTPLWIAHAGLAALWAHELGDTEWCAEQLLTNSPSEVAWRNAFGQWLFGLVAEARGKGPQALTHLQAAVSDPQMDLPFYAAHMLVDHARIAHLLGDPATAEDSLVKAADLYTQLGATAYVERIDAARQASGKATPGRKEAVLLTDREQDVLTLIASGMSYAQIARDLFVTQSTVGYHLSNIYRKAGVGSRHELTELVRQDPLGFGIAPS